MSSVNLKKRNSSTAVACVSCSVSFSYNGLIVLANSHLTECQRIEMLIMLGCGDGTRTQKVRGMRNNKYSDNHISQSTVTRIETKFREFGSVTDMFLKVKSTLIK